MITPTVGKAGLGVEAPAVIERVRERALGFRCVDAHPLQNLVARGEAAREDRVGRVEVHEPREVRVQAVALRADDEHRVRAKWLIQRERVTEAGDPALSRDEHHGGEELLRAAARHDEVSRVAFGQPRVERRAHVVERDARARADLAVLHARRVAEPRAEARNRVTDPQRVRSATSDATETSPTSSRSIWSGGSYHG